MRSPSIRDKIFSNRKRFFLIGNSIFWLCIGIGNLFVEPPLSTSFEEISRPFRIPLLGFISFYPLRYLYKKYNCHRSGLLKLIFQVIVGSITVGFLWTYSQIVVNSFLYNYSPFISPLIISSSLYLNSFAGFLWSSLYLGYKILEDLKDQKYLLEHERALLKTAQLEMLKYQLNPHFLFNSLSSLRGLITVEPLKAKEMVTHISEFLRYSLLEGKNNEVQLIKEIEIIKQYLNIEQVRYNEDLIVGFDVSPGTHDFMIPIFLIHPLVENAVKHGIQTSSLPLKIFISSSIINNNLLMEVKNSGKWIEPNKKLNPNRTGIGLQNIQKRLQHSYPNSHTFEIIKDTDFVKVVIIITTDRDEQRKKI